MDDPFSPDKIARIDKKGIHATYERWPTMAREGFDAKFPFPKAGFKKAFFLGMGGSAAGGDIIASWLWDRPELEIEIFKGRLPIGDLSDVLAVACSASGETEETIEMMQAAVRGGATTLSLSSGGRLVDVSKRLGVPHVLMPKAAAPRYLLPFVVFSCLAIVNAGLGLGCEDDAEDAFREMEAEGRSVGAEVPLSQNPSKQLALLIMQKTPVVYGSRSTRGAGVRFKSMLNENAKRHAVFDELPVAFHDEIESWEDPSGGYLPIFLRHSAEAERDRVMTDKMAGILSGLGMNPVQVSGRGRTHLAQLATMVYRLDMTSYYLSVGLGRDPLPTRLIDKMKEK